MSWWWLAFAFFIIIGVVIYLWMRYAVLEIFSGLVAMKPDDIEGWLEYIKLTYRRKDYSKCIGGCLGVIEWGATFEQYPVLLYYLWKSYDAMYYFDIAEMYYNKLLQADISFEEKEDEWLR